MSLDDAFDFVDLESDDILDNILRTEGSSRKTSLLWNYVDCKSPTHPGGSTSQHNNSKGQKANNTKFQIVMENEKFIEMMHIFDPRYKIPDQHQIKEMIIDEFNERRSNIGYDLQKISSKVSFTADIWTSTISSEAYLGLTISHYIDQN
ncbi:zinc finger BED domain-containing protein 1-like [Rhizophagus irregularis DAOM 181602=DAOM 197198]|nr:zinc finger BED domain-containing protein 1-like [Rhizophagus irregularis DAOM 181602=DAOM 197198]